MNNDPLKDIEEKYIKELYNDMENHIKTHYLPKATVREAIENTRGTVFGNDVIARTDLLQALGLEEKV